MLQTMNGCIPRKAAAAYLGLSVSGLAHMACEGRGPRFYKVGRHTWYYKQDLDAWISSQVREPLPAKLQPFIRRRRPLRQR